jgi:hypothetical protein
VKNETIHVFFVNQSFFFVNRPLFSFGPGATNAPFIGRRYFLSARIQGSALMPFTNMNLLLRTSRRTLSCVEYLVERIPQLVVGVFPISEENHISHPLPLLIA